MNYFDRKFWLMTAGFIGIVIIALLTIIILNCWDGFDIVQCLG